jgi:hypothetical protein
MVQSLPVECPIKVSHFPGSDEFEMSYKGQVTCGLITKIEPKQLYILVTAETDHQGQHYVTVLRAGFTNYRLEAGDALSWSSCYAGERSSVLWRSSSARPFPLCKFWLLTVESQRIVRRPNLAFWQECKSSAVARRPFFCSKRPIIFSRIF